MYGKTIKIKNLVRILKDKKVQGRNVEHTSDYVYKTQAITKPRAFIHLFFTTFFFLIG
jgi:hypothetical protein